MEKTRKVGTVSRGIRCPIIREGDDLAAIVTESVLDAAASEGFELRDRDVISMTPDVQAATDRLRAFLFERVYYNPIAKSEEQKSKELVYTLFAYYVKNPDRLPERYRRRIGTDEGETVERAVADFISGMTDRYAIETYEEKFVPRVWRGLHE